MKLKLAIIYGILIWTIIYFLSPLFNTFHLKIITPIILIIITGFFGILYIRNFDNNEVLEGFLLGIIFVTIGVILDFTQSNLTNSQNAFSNDYTSYLLLKVVLTILITTFLGYLAQMKIDLK
ncbi:MAG: hypothetical protein IKF11_08770 [Methanobrevibacter sp.]|nr:hypothetical protein [Methanobrevibacter sp.]